MSLLQVILRGGAEFWFASVTMCKNVASVPWSLDNIASATVCPTLNLSMQICPMPEQASVHDAPNSPQIHSPAELAENSDMVDFTRLH